MMRCVVTQAKRVRQLEQHQRWLQRNITSKQIQAQRHRALLILRTDLCIQLGCASAAGDAAWMLRADRTKTKSGPEGPL
jgi:hypothetical protein